MKRYPKAFYKQYLLVIWEAIFLGLSTRIAGLWLRCRLMLAPNRYGGGGGREWCQLPGAAERTGVGPGQCLPQHWPGFREGGQGAAQAKLKVSRVSAKSWHPFTSQDKPASGLPLNYSKVLGAKRGHRDSLLSWERLSKTLSWFPVWTMGQT